MKLDVKTDKKDPTVKKVKIKKAGKKDGTTTFVSGDGGVNPNLADGGWHEVKIKNMLDITVSFDGETVTGLLKELKVKLDKSSTTAAPVVKDFKIDITGVTTALDVKKGTVASVVVTIPATTVTALATTDYDEELKDKPEVLGGHTEAEFKRAKNAVTEGVDIASLSDGFNDQLKERKGPCSISAAPVSLPKLAGTTDHVTVQETIPEGYALEQNYPNPFNPSTTITFGVPEASEVTLAIYNLRGQVIRTLHSGPIAAGQHSVVWNGTDFRGAKVASGVYVYRLEGKRIVVSKKLVFTK
ncbi:T9SS type A sorting domain-containing protein [candidate division KSB1 bacterium]|nr:T9SS type A sorting domain-containing protein [candidate division KSB1 bacterium]